MSKVILTNEQNRVINDGEHKVVCLEAIRLFTASEAANVLHINKNAVYALWRKNLLDYWNINGTMVTNLIAINNFLERTKDMELNIEKEANT